MIDKLKEIYFLIANFVITKMQSTVTRLCVEIVGFLIIAIILINMIIGLLHSHHQTIETISKPAKISPIVKDEPKIDIKPIKPIKAYKQSKDIKAKVKMPQQAIDDDNQQVVAVSHIDLSDYQDKTVTTILDTNTGNVINYVKNEPKPLFAWDTHGEIGIYAGIKNGQQSIRLQGKQNIFDVKNVQIGINGSIDQALSGNTDYFIGIGASYNW